MKGLRLLDGVGVLCGMAAVVALVAGAPDEPAENPRPRALPVIAPGPDRAGPPARPLRVHFPVPPILPEASLRRRAPLSYGVSLPSHTEPHALSFRGHRLAAGPRGAELTVEPSDLLWGLNPIHVTGADRFGRPIDQAFSLLVGSTRPGSSWIDGAVSAGLTREGFVDDDDRVDDLSAIARAQALVALRQIPDVEVGPVSVGNFRAADAEVELRPVTGGVEVHLMLHRALMDIQTRRLGRIENIPILRMGLNARLTAEADAQGRPRVELVELEPDIDLIERTEGALNWILFHTAAIVEAVAEALSREPIQAAVTDALDDLLQRWVDQLEIETVPPLRRQTLRIAYRFASIDFDETGLAATLDVQVGCPDEPSPGIGRLVRHPGRGLGPPSSGLGAPIAWASLSTDAVNGVLHALWRCGALDTVVDFSAAQEQVPLLVPGAITTSFGLPPVLQADRTGRMTIGVGQVVAEAHYVDVAYEVGATGLIPIALEPTDDGRGLSVGFDATQERLELYTDCLRTEGHLCRDNPLFDRLAWLAVPYLPPIGATLPIPDLRLSDDPTHQLQVRLDTIAFDAERDRIDVAASYLLER